MLYHIKVMISTKMPLVTAETHWSGRKVKWVTLEGTPWAFFE